MKYDIFISYRREGGYETAKHLNDLLVRDGYRVSFDIDTLRSGDFDKQLLNRIDECRDFILIVDAHAFDRTLDPSYDPQKDWLRCELAYALRKKKNIIPVFLSGINSFPEGLPNDISDVAKKNGPEYNKFYFNDFYKTLKKRFLHNKSRSRILKLIIFVALLISICTTYFFIHNKNQTTEKTYVDASVSIMEPEYGIETGFEKSDELFVGRITSISHVDEDPNSIVLYITEEKTQAKHQFFLDTEDMCNADLSWLPYILIENNKVEVSYYFAGNFGFRYIISIRNLPE